MKYRPDIDGLRAVAVLSVVSFHALPGYVPGGFVGVDVFFVISGYLVSRIIHHELRAGSFSILRFYDRRVRRILPALAVVVAATLAAACLLYLPHELRQTGEAAMWSMAFLANMYFLLEVDYFAAPEDTQPLLHLWSLGVEEQFYIVTPLLLALAFRFGARAVVLVLLAASTLSFAASAGVVHLHQKSAFYAIPFRFWELGLGAFLGVTGWAPAGRWRREAASVAGLLLIMAPIFLYSPGTVFPGAAALPPCLGAALLIAAGPSGVANRLLSAPVAVGIGLISYSLYLWHWPVFAFAHYRLMRAPDLGEAVLLVGLSVLLAVASYRYVETPFRHGRRHAPHRSVLAGVGAIAVVGTAALALSQSDGLRSRWQAETLALLEIGSQGPHDDARPCRRLRPEGYRGEGACIIGDADLRPDFVVWGDSHAGALVPGFRTMAAAHGASGVVIRKNACPPLLGVARRDMPVWHRCSAHNAGILDYVAAVRPGTVYLVGRWALVASDGRPYGNESHAGVRFAYAAHAAQAATRGRFSAALRRTVETLRQTGVRVVVVDSVPEVGWDVPTVLARAAEWDAEAPRAPTRAAFARRQAGVRDGLAGLDVVVLRPADVLCEGSGCRVAADGVPLYSDDDHLSPYGASLLAPLLGSGLRLAGSSRPHDRRTARRMGTPLPHLNRSGLERPPGRSSEGAGERTE